LARLLGRFSSLIRTRKFVHAVAKLGQQSADGEFWLQPVAKLTRDNVAGFLQRLVEEIPWVVGNLQSRPTLALPAV